MTISTSPKLYTTGSTSLVAFPLGMALTLTVEFYNNIGEKFHAQNTQIYLALNRYSPECIGTELPKATEKNTGKMLLLQVMAEVKGFASQARAICEGSCSEVNS